MTLILKDIRILTSWLRYKLKVLQNLVYIVLSKVGTETAQNNHSDIREACSTQRLMLRQHIPRITTRLEKKTKNLLI